MVAAPRAGRRVLAVGVQSLRRARGGWEQSEAVPAAPESGQVGKSSAARPEPGPRGGHEGAPLWGGGPRCWGSSARRFPFRMAQTRGAACPEHILSEEDFHDRVVHLPSRAGRGAGFLGEGKVHFRRDGRAEGSPLSHLCRVPGDSCAQRRPGAATEPRTERQHDSRLRGGGRPSSLHHPQAAPPT